MFIVRQFEAKTASWWATQRRNIDMDPPYQRRGGVWSTSDQALLVDSMINGFDIPKFYLADFSYGSSKLNVTSHQFAVIDGKQRLGAIFGFANNEFPLADSFQFFDDPSVVLRSLYYRDLVAIAPDVAARFENFNLSVMSVITDDEAKINEMFVRLNRSKPLTGAEIRNAMAGAVPPIIRNISGHTFFKNYVKFQTLRGQDQNLAAKLLLLEFRGGFADTKKADLDGMVRQAADASASVEDFERAAARCAQTLTLMCGVFHFRDPLLSAQGLVPLWYWMTRSIDIENLPFLRLFLVSVQERRRRHRVLIKDHGPDHPSADRELLDFEVRARNINDQGSLVRLYGYLEKWFAEYRSG